MVVTTIRLQAKMENNKPRQKTDNSGGLERFSLHDLKKGAKLDEKSSL